MRPETILLLALAAGCAVPPARLTTSPVSPPGASPDPGPAASATPFPPQAPTSLPPCEATAFTVADFEYESLVLGSLGSARVFRPECGSGRSGTHPVIFLLHGSPRSAAEWEALGFVEDYRAAMSRGEAVPAILVIPVMPVPLLSDTDGGPGSYEAELVGSLVPSLEARVPGLGGADERVIAGISRGGVWALEIVLRNPFAFHSAAALSPSLVLNYARPEFNPFQLTASARNLVGVGDEDWARAKTEELASVLQADGGVVRLEIVPGAHVDSTWQSLFEPLIDFLNIG
jgi:enterochelin esterase-like enzyme